MTRSLPDTRNRPGVPRQGWTRITDVVGAAIMKRKVGRLLNRRRPSSGLSPTREYVDFVRKETVLDGLAYETIRNSKTARNNGSIFETRNYQFRYVESDKNHGIYLTDRVP